MKEKGGDIKERNLGQRLKSGFSLLEVLIGLGIVSMIMTQVLYISFKNQQRTILNGQRLQAFFLAKQLEEVSNISTVKTAMQGDTAGSDNKDICFTKSGDDWSYSNAACDSPPAVPIIVDYTTFNRSVKISAKAPGSGGGVANNNYRKVDIKIEWGGGGALKTINLSYFLVYDT